MNKTGEVLYDPPKPLICKGKDQIAQKEGNCNSAPDGAGSHRLRLLATGQDMEAPAGASLLQSLHREGVAWPSSCRNGACRVCIGRLVSGSVRYRVEWPGLLPEEKTAGAVLPCVACPTSDVVLAPPQQD